MQVSPINSTNVASDCSSFRIEEVFLQCKGQKVGLICGCKETAKELDLGIEVSACQCFMESRNSIQSGLGCEQLRVKQHRTC